jgi:hypothetical protein
MAMPSSTANVKLVRVALDLFGYAMAIKNLRGKANRFRRFLGF